MTILITTIDPDMSRLIWGVGGLIMLIAWYFQIDTSKLIVGGSFIMFLK
jgi:uncharacterized membrane protein